MRKKLIALAIIFTMSFSLFGCFLTFEPMEIISLELENYDDVEIEYTFLILTSYTGKLNYEAKNTSCSSLVNKLEIVIDNNEIIFSADLKASSKGDYIEYKIIPKYNGEFNLYIKSKDGLFRTKSKKFIVKGGTNNPNAKYYLNENAGEYSNYNVNFKINFLENAKRFGSPGNYIETQNNYMLVGVLIKNNGSSAFSINPRYCELRKYKNNSLVSEYSYDSNTYLFDYGMRYDKINPGLEKQYVILFETDTTTDEDEYRLKCGGLLGKGVEIILKFRP